MKCQIMPICLGHKRETGVKSVMLRVSYWKIYEMALWKGDSCDKLIYNI